MMHEPLGRYIADIKQYPRISPEREVELSSIILKSKKAEEVEGAVNELIVSNLRLVVHCAKDFLHYTTRSDTCLTEMDLIAEGNVGLMCAAKGFNAQFESGSSKGSTVKFSTYACKCIKRRMLRAIRLSRFIHIPEHHFTCRRRIAELEDEQGTLPEETISNELGITRNKLRMVREGQESYTCRLEELIAEDDGASHWSDIVENPKAVRPDESVSGTDLRSFVMSEIDKLPPRTRDIILKVFLSQRPFTFRELSSEFKVSKERCRQICVQGLKALRRQIEPRWGKSVGVGLVFRQEDERTDRKKERRQLVLLSADSGGDGHVETNLPEDLYKSGTSGMGLVWPQFDEKPFVSEAFEDLETCEASVA